MIDDFLLRAGLAGIAVAIVAAPLGALVIWRRMAFFGAAVAHGGLLGIGLAVLVGVNYLLGVAFAAFAMAVAFVQLERMRVAPADTLLGILAHVALAAGLIVANLAGVNTNLESLLFGDILGVGWDDLMAMALLGGGIVVALAWLWRPLLAVSINAELAQVEGLPVARLQLLFLLLIAATVAIAMKIVGLLLIAALLVLPASTARRFSKTPEQMALGAVLVAIFAVVAGLVVSALFDVMTGPAIVLVMAAAFACSLLAQKR